MRKRFTALLMICFALLSIATMKAEDKVPVTIFDFGEGPNGWVVKEFSSLATGQEMSNWYWRPNSWYNVSAGMWYSETGPFKKVVIRNTMIYSPVIDLANKAEVEMYVTLAQAWSGDGNNFHHCYVQDVDSLDLDQPVDTLLIQEWSKSWDLSLETRDFVDMGLASKPSDKVPFTAGPLSLAKFDGKKVRIAFHVWNVLNGIDFKSNYRNFVVKDLTLAALTDDSAAPVGNIEKIDSIGNTFMRPHYKADEICKVYWAAMPKGEMPVDYDDLVNNVGTDKFISSGSFNYNVPGSDKSFFVQGLSIDEEFTISFVAEDYKGNKTSIQSIDQKTIIDLVPPVITEVTPLNVTEITAETKIAADESGWLRYRVYEAGLEPADFDQFNAGTGSVIQTDVPIEEDSTVLLEGLELNTTYIVYAVVTDMTGNISAIKKSETFTTLADTKAPVISSISLGDAIANHTATIKFTADEPTAGYGAVTCYWSATLPSETLSADDIMNRVKSLASGSTSDLDSASYENTLTINNLNTNTEYKVHMILVDASENVSEVSSITLTTANEIERIPAFVNDFNVEGQNYHFIEVLKQEGADDHWKSFPNGYDESIVDDLGYVFVGRTNLSGKGEEAWCIVGPMDLTNLTNLSATTDIYKGYGGDTRNSLSMLISKTYKPEDGVIDMNKWSEFASVGDMTFGQKILWSMEKEIPTDLNMDTAGVYIAIRFNHNSWALNYNIYNLKVFADLTSAPPAPIIDWVEVMETSSTDATVSFTGSTHGRMFYYILKDTGGVVTAPTFEKAKSGEGADVFGYKDYNAGSFIDQRMTIGGLEPSSKYYLYTTFRSNLYAWADEIFYDDEVSVIETADLEMDMCDTSAVFATRALVKTSAMASGRIYYTLKPAGEPAPESLEDIQNSFHKKGNVRYNITDGTALEWEISNLVPYTDYELYVSFADNGGAYGSEITKIPFTTLDLLVDSIEAEEPFLVSDTVDLYNVAITAQSTDKGTLYMMVTAADAAIPTAQDVMAGTDAIRSTSVSVDDPEDIIIVADSLTQEQSNSFEAWFVLKTGSRVSKVFALNQEVAYTYSAKFKVKDLDGTPLQGVVVKVGEEEAVTNPSGIATFYELTPADYDYELTRADLVKSVSGSVSIIDKNETVDIAYDTQSEFAAMFIVLDKTGTPVAGATITIGETSVVTDAEGKASIPGLAPADYSYSVTTSANALEVTGSVTITDMDTDVNVEYDITNGVGSIEFASLEVYPNPASGFLKVRIDSKAQLTLVDLTGKTVANHAFAGGEFTMSTANLNSGIYMLTVELESGANKTLKVIVK